MKRTKIEIKYLFDKNVYTIKYMVLSIFTNKNCIFIIGGYAAKLRVELQDQQVNSFFPSSNTVPSFLYNKVFFLILCIRLGESVP